MKTKKVGARESGHETHTKLTPTLLFHIHQKERKGAPYYLLYLKYHQIRYIIWHRFFAGKSMDKLEQFEYSRHLSNLAYAYALIEYVLKFDDGSDLLFDHIATQENI
ncbi:hypothetical protein ACHAXM_000057 [Skeletonema potamos]